jgi:prepilin-type N-terminal cleavage/methylation domain-containing protein/prepilin-type processing-associated H-X9-DG protein
VSGRRLKAFTLIELLVVVAIIAIIAGILFPVFSKVREKGRQAACISNLRQISAAMLMYAEANDELFPPVVGREGDEPLAYPATWMARLRPYLGCTDVLVDRASGHTNQDWHTSNDLMANYGYPPSRRVTGLAGQVVVAGPYGSAMWEGLGGYYGPRLGDYLEEAPSCRLSQVARPTETVLVCDHTVFDWGASVQKVYFPSPRHIRKPNRELPDGRSIPQGLINVAFVDGHVKAMQHEQLWTIYPNYSRLGRGSPDVFAHFWPYE